MTDNGSSNRTNYHSHCSFCDGHAPIASFVEEAIRQGFVSYGISSHAPLPFPTRWTMNHEQMPDYLAEITRLKSLYSDQIELYAGLEIDYLNETSNPASPYFQELPLDYRIGSVHMLQASSGEYVDIDTRPEQFAENLHTYFDNNLRQLTTAYFEKQIRMVQGGGFDFVGHADKMLDNARYCQADITEQGWCKDLIRTYFEQIAAQAIPVEINTKKYLRAGIFFPDRRYFSLLKELHIPVLVNSDAHFPATISSGRPEALQALQEAGINTVLQLQQGVWQEVGIR